MKNVNSRSSIHFSRLVHECNVFRIYAVARVINRIRSRISIPDTYQDHDIGFRSPPLQIGFPGQQQKLQDLLRQVRVEAGMRQVNPAERLGEPKSFVSRLRSASVGWT